MSTLNDFMNYKILESKFREMDEGEQAVDVALDRNEPGPPPKKNVCAALDLDLVQRLENALALMNTSKRLFVEMALVDALDNFDQICLENDVPQIEGAWGWVDRVEANSPEDKS